MTANDSDDPESVSDKGNANKPQTRADEVDWGSEVQEEEEMRARAMWNWTSGHLIQTQLSAKTVEAASMQYYAMLALEPMNRVVGGGRLRLLNPDSRKRVWPSQCQACEREHAMLFLVEQIFGKPILLHAIEDGRNTTRP